MTLLETSWEEREEVVYKELLGDTGPGIYPISAISFERANVHQVDPRWLSYGVFRCPPVDGRPTWRFVTSGLSNPNGTEDPQEYSGLGVEFILETHSEEDWPIHTLHMLTAYHLATTSGQLGNVTPLDYGHRMRAGISEKISAIMITEPPDIPKSFKIKSGQVDWLWVVGITANELEFAQKTSSDELKKELLRKTGGLATAKDRESII